MTCPPSPSGIEFNKHSCVASRWERFLMPTWACGNNILLLQPISIGELRKPGVFIRTACSAAKGIQQAGDASRLSDRSYATFGLRPMNPAANLRESLQNQRTGVVAQFFHRPQNARGRFFVRAALWRLCMGGFGLPGFYDRSTTPCTVASLLRVVAKWRCSFIGASP